MTRARETANLARLGDALEITDDLVELGYGDYEGLTTAEIRVDRPGWDLWRDGSPSGEPLADAAARVDRVIERVADADGDVAIFAHGHILRIFGARWIGQPAETAASLALHTAALCDLGYERERRVIWLWNDTSHTVESRGASGAPLAYGVGVPDVPRRTPYTASSWTWTAHGRSPERGLILRTTVGSVVHGLSNRAPTIATSWASASSRPSTCSGFRRFEHFVYRTQPEGMPSGPGASPDLTVYGLRKYCQLALKGSPTVLLPLFVGDDEVVARTELGAELQALAGAFVSQSTGPRSSATSTRSARA